MSDYSVASGRRIEKDQLESARHLGAIDKSEEYDINNPHVSNDQSYKDNPFLQEREQDDKLKLYENILLG